MEIGVALIGGNQVALNEGNRLALDGGNSAQQARISQQRTVTSLPDAVTKQLQGDESQCDSLNRHSECEASGARRRTECEVEACFDGHG